MSRVAAPRWAATCPVCGKRCYRSRADARRAIARLRSLAGTRFRAYQCRDAWHVATWQPAGKVAWYRDNPGEKSR